MVELSSVPAIKVSHAHYLVWPLGLSARFCRTRRPLIDPFFTGNPAFVSDKAAAIKGVEHIVLTHGHFDHVVDTLDIAKSNGATVTTNYDLGMWLVAKGLEKLNPMNTGSTTDLGGFTVSLVRADHSWGGAVNGTPIYVGNPCGVVIKAAGEPMVYHMGDTDVFSDMGLIAEIHQPRIAMVPIGDRFTMDAVTAAMAVKRFFKLDTAIPCHYGTFPIIEGTPDKFVAAMKGHATRVLVPERANLSGSKTFAASHDRGRHLRRKSKAPGLCRAL
jgi:L-ascorbate metabolism protein UlaG (beta-lactamase superfamily)